ncbi:MAG: hypothetical protein HY738_11325 [Bacteroidia bacterium]|nr:hypothetical protein [Bacteroidia bacterium]
MKTLLFTLIASLLYADVAFSQANPNNFEFAMLYISTGKTRPLSNPAINTDQHLSNAEVPVYERVCMVEMSDTTTIAHILIDVGSKKDSADIFSYAFAYDDTLGLPEGTSYSREGNRLHLGIFETLQTDMYHYKVRIQDKNGIISEPKYFY